jgi:hypothetical protein
MPFVAMPFEQFCTEDLPRRPLSLRRHRLKAASFEDESDYAGVDRIKRLLRSRSDPRFVVKDDLAIRRVLLPARKHSRLMLVEDSFVIKRSKSRARIPIVQSSKSSASSSTKSVLTNDQVAPGELHKCHEVPASDRFPEPAEFRRSWLHVDAWNTQIATDASDIIRVIRRVSSRATMNTPTTE